MFTSVPDAAARYTLSRSTFHEQIKAGLMTAPVRISKRRVALPVVEVEAIEAARVAGAEDDAIRALVRKLMAARHAEGGAL